MRAPISGIVTGYRVKKGGAKESDYGELDVLQVGDSRLASSLTFVYVEDFELMTYLLAEYSSGTLRWIDLYCYQIQQGRELVWILDKIFGFEANQIPVESA